MEEMIEIVDPRGNVIRVAPRSEVHGNPSLMHRVVHVLVFNSKGELFLQKRSMDKDVAPGKWDTSVGGHVEAGESLGISAMREMKEELGIMSDPEFLYTYIHTNSYESEMVYTYKCMHNGPIVFNEVEIDEVRPWSLNEIMRNMGNGKLSDNFEHEFRKYLNFLDSPDPI